MRSFSNVLDDSSSEEVLLHSSGYVWGGVSFTLLIIVLVSSFSYSPQPMFDEEFLLHF